MLSPGVRIGPARILEDLREGAAGEGYVVLGEAGKGKGERLFAKVLPKELVEGAGFSDHFLRECQVIEQLEGDGIVTPDSCGVTKWKHWLRYPLEEGVELAVEAQEPETAEALDQAHADTPDPNAPAAEPLRASSLEQLLEVRTEGLSPEEALPLLTTMLLGLRTAHVAGVLHGNLKPSNVLLGMNEEGAFAARLSEFGLVRLVGEDWFRERWETVSAPPAAGESAPSPQASSLRQTYLHRPPEQVNGGEMNECGDLYAIGLVARRLLTGCSPEAVRSDQADAELPLAWSQWLAKMTAEDPEERFRDAERAVAALPGVGDLSRFGIKALDESDEDAKVDLEEIRRRRRKEWETAQREHKRKIGFRITSLLGGLFLVWYVFSSVYLWLCPVPWKEYEDEESGYRYQLGPGLLSGKAWGLAPPLYDPEKTGGRNVSGEWTKEDGHFRLAFRMFKHAGEDAGSKKRWQAMGLDSASPEDYFNWVDYLRYDRGNDVLVFEKRIGDKQETYRPVRDEDDELHLYTQDYAKRNRDKFRPAELRFRTEETSRSHWSLFFGLGFLVAGLLYRYSRTSDDDEAEDEEGGAEKSGST